MSASTTVFTEDQLRAIGINPDDVELFGVRVIDHEPVRLYRENDVAVSQTGRT